MSWKNTPFIPPLITFCLPFTLPSTAGCLYRWTGQQKMYTDEVVVGGRDHRDCIAQSFEFLQLMMDTEVQSCMKIILPLLVLKP